MKASIHLHTITLKLAHLRQLLAVSLAFYLHFSTVSVAFAGPTSQCVALLSAYHKSTQFATPKSEIQTKIAFSALSVFANNQLPRDGQYEPKFLRSPFTLINDKGASAEKKLKLLGHIKGILGSRDGDNDQSFFGIYLTGIKDIVAFQKTLLEEEEFFLKSTQILSENLLRAVELKNFDLLLRTSGFDVLSSDPLPHGKWLYSYREFSLRQGTINLFLNSTISPTMESQVAEYEDEIAVMQEDPVDRVLNWLMTRWSDEARTDHARIYDRNWVGVNILYQFDKGEPSMTLLIRTEVRPPDYPQVKEDAPSLRELVPSRVTSNINRF